MEYIDPTLGDAVVTYHPGCTGRGTEARILLGSAAEDDQTSRTKVDGCMTPTIVVRDVHNSFGDGLPGQELRGKVALVAPRMGKRVLQSDAPGEYSDLYFREVVI